jgi:hypothetical protein
METLSEAAHLQQSSRHPRRVHIPRKSFYYLRHILEFRTRGKLSAPARVCASLRQVSGSAYSARETQHVGLVVEYASVTSLWRNTKRRTPVTVSGRSVG